MARLMVELHGGRLWMESWKGRERPSISRSRSRRRFGRRDRRLSKEPESAGLFSSLARRVNAMLARLV